jgi:hypothetical protein
MAVTANDGMASTGWSNRKSGGAPGRVQTIETSSFNGDNTVFILPVALEKRGVGMPEVGSQYSASEEVLGSADIQSLADLNNSNDIVRGMRAVPFGLDDISLSAAATAAPLVPLLLTIFLRKNSS